MLCKLRFLATVGGNESWFFVLRVKSELSWAVYQLGVSEWVGRWLDKRQQQHKVCGQQQQQPWLSISQQQIMRKAHITTAAEPSLSVLQPNSSVLSLGCEDNPWPILYNLISAATLRNKKHPLFVLSPASWSFSLSPCLLHNNFQTYRLQRVVTRAFFFLFFAYWKLFCVAPTHTDTKLLYAFMSDENNLLGRK